MPEPSDIIIPPTAAAIAAKAVLWITWPNTYSFNLVVIADRPTIWIL